MNEYYFGLPDALWLLSGLWLLSRWLQCTGWGRTALDDSPLNSMGDRLASLAGRKGSWRKSGRAFPVYAVAFFGLTFGTLGLTIVIGRWLGYDQVQRHDTLEQLSHCDDPIHIIKLCLNAALIAPLTEEFLFRGLAQNGLIVALTVLFNPPSMLPDPLLVADRPASRPGNRTRWTAIVIASLVFASSHADRQHWPALFVFSMGLGYSYEKQGNIAVPVVLHALFNSLVLSVNLLQPGG